MDVNVFVPIALGCFAVVCMVLFFINRQRVIDKELAGLISLDDVLTNPAKYYDFDAEEWHGDVLLLIDDEAFMAAAEEVGPNSHEFYRIRGQKSDKLWAILDARLKQSSNKLPVS